MEEIDALPAMVPESGHAQRPLAHPRQARLERPWIAAEEGDPPPHDAPEEGAGTDLSATFEPEAFRCEPGYAPALTRAAFYAEVVHDAADRLAALGEHRLRWPVAEKPAAEARALAQVDALVCIGTPAIPALEAWWHAGATPWASFAYVFALACIEGREPLEKVAAHVAALDPEATEHRRLAAEAFAASPNPHAQTLARVLVANPATIPAAIEILSLRDLIGEADLLAWLARGEPAVQAAALRALVRLDVAPAPTVLAPWLASPSPEVAWECARALAVAGSHLPLSQLRHGGPLLETLGPRAAEILVLSGHADDAALMQRIVRRHEASAELLDAVARFGHPGTWAFLSYYLSDTELGADALAALHVLFGDAVPDEAALDLFAWERAVAGLRLAPDRRYRRGRPWSPAIVARECITMGCSRLDLESRLDELRSRAGIQVHAPLHLWSQFHARMANDLSNAATAARHRPGDWS